MGTRHGHTAQTQAIGKRPLSSIPVKARRVTLCKDARLVRPLHQRLQRHILTRTATRLDRTPTAPTHSDFFRFAKVLKFFYYLCY